MSAVNHSRSVSGLKSDDGKQEVPETCKRKSMPMWYIVGDYDESVHLAAKAPRPCSFFDEAEKQLLRPAVPCQGCTNGFLRTSTTPEGAAPPPIMASGRCRPPAFSLPFSVDAGMKTPLVSAPVAPTTPALPTPTPPSLLWLPPSVLNPYSCSASRSDAPYWAEEESGVDALSGSSSPSSVAAPVSWSPFAPLGSGSSLMSKKRRSSSSLKHPVAAVNAAESQARLSAAAR